MHGTEIMLSRILKSTNKSTTWIITYDTMKLKSHIPTHCWSQVVCLMCTYACGSDLALCVHLLVLWACVYTPVQAWLIFCMYQVALFHLKYEWIWNFCEHTREKWSSFCMHTRIGVIIARIGIIILVHAHVQAWSRLCVHTRVSMTKHMCAYTHGHDHAYVCIHAWAWPRLCVHGHDRAYVCIQVWA